MSGLPHAPSRCKYSWWWDSHITPKNSKWLQENLTDMDSKIKAIIKLIEEDADSFARRAEMYYKKRPELMKLVEEFYRAYRALAERYDNATGVIRQAQRTMVEMFPNQDPLGITDDSLASDHLQNGLSFLNGGDTKQFAEDKVRKGLDFYEDLSVSEVVGIFENEIQVLKDALSQLEVEKEAGIVQYEDSLEKLSKLEEVSRELLDRANRAEEGFQVLKDSLTKLEAENEATLLEYQNCLVISTNLEKNLSQAKDEAYKATCEKDEALDQYEQSLVKVLNLEINLKLAEENARDLMERADISEREIEDLKKALAKLTTEKESNILQYNKCLEEISNLKNQISSAKELSVSLEKSNEALNLELGSLVLKMSSQSEELTEKEKKLGEIWSCLEEERLRFIEAETNLQKLQNLHSETQDQLRFLALELEKKSNEMLRINEENKSLNKCILSSSMAIKEMKNDISDIVESKKKLADEVEIAMDQRIQLLSRPEFWLQTEKSDLNEILEQEKAEKLLILKKLETMEQIIGKNALSKSLLDLTDELEVARGKIRALEQSFEALLEEKTANLAEKAAIISQLKAKIEKLEKISEKNKTLKDSYELLEKAEFYLTDEKDTLDSQGETTQQALEALGKRPGKLEAKCSGSETELESNFLKLEEICFLSDAEKKESSTVAQRTETELAGMGGQICHLQEEVYSRKKEFEDELDKTVNYQFEIFILRRCIEDLKENNSSLLMEVKYLSDKTQIIDMEKETLIKELKIKNELWIWSQNEANKLVELNGDLEKKLDKLTSLNAKINREIEEFNVIINNREYQIYKLSGENRELEVEIKKLKDEHGVITQLSDGEIYELKDRVIKKDAKIDLMEKKNGFLERENGRLKAQLASYGPLVMSLKDSVSSLENRTSCTKGQKRQNDGEKEVVSVNCKNGSADSKALDINSELKDLQHKLKVIERTFIQKEKHEAKENHDTNTNLEIANKTIDSLKIKTCTNKEYSVPIYNKSDFENESTMKDIMLDKNSESSSYELSRRLERKFRSKRVESWDSTDLDHSIEFTIGKGKRVKSQKSKFESSDIEVEKELGVDTLEISRTFSQRSQEATKTKILERLNSDAQKLSDLQINIQDLLDKVENIEKRKKGKSIYKGDDTLREQLEEAEEAIIKLFDYNGKLMRNVEKRSFSSNVKLGVDSEECSSARRRKIAEQARKTSEKIGKWQTEVQKIKNLMLKTDEKNEKETKGKSRVTDIRKRVMLRDYLYGSLRSPSHELRKKSSSFCVCVQPSTRGD